MKNGTFVGRIRSIALAMALLFAPDLWTQSVKALPDYCSNICDYSTNCYEACYDGGVTICGQWRNPWDDLSCDGTSWQTCGYICPDSSGSTQCKNEGTLTTCSSYGFHLQCGDGDCAEWAGEDEDNCSADCVNQVPEPHDDASFWNYVDMWNEVEAAVGSGRTPLHGAIALGIAHQHGLLPAAPPYIDWASSFSDTPEHCDGQCILGYGGTNNANLNCGDKEVRERQANRAALWSGGVAAGLATAAAISGVIPGGQGASAALWAGSAAFGAFAAGFSALGYVIGKQACRG